MQYTDLTQHEIEALKNEYNLADAHTHQSQSPSQQEIVQRLPELWYESENLKQHEMEDRFLNSFFTFHKQPTALQTPSMLVYASSIAMITAANYFKKKNMSVALLTPCFDNVHDILVHLEVPLEPLHEEWLHNPYTLYDTLKKNVTADVLFIVTPNNPTGWELTGEAGKNYTKGFEELIRFAKEYNKLLSFDFCFASAIIHSKKVPSFDVYKLLEESQVSYISYEDTGKTWPLQDAKVAIIKCSKDIYPELYDIHTAYLLNVSPFILNLITQYIEDSIQDDGESIVALLEKNRAIAKRYLEGEFFTLMQPQISVSVAWLRIQSDKVTATELQKKIYEMANVYVLPGTYFYWDDKNRGERYIRIALARDTDMFEAAMKQLSAALPSIIKECYA